MREKERELLLDHPKEPSRCLIWTKLTLEELLGFAGLGVIFFYAGPSIDCAESEYSKYCGQWLTNRVSKEVAVPIFFGGGAGFAAATYALSKEVFSAFEKSLTGLTPIEKIVKSSVIVLFAFSQTVPLFLNALITAPNPVIIAISVAASLSSAFYGAAEFIDARLLYLWKYFRSLYNNTHQDVITRLERNFYLKELEEFKKRVNKNYWNKVLTSRNLQNADPVSMHAFFPDNDNIDAVLTAKHTNIQYAMESSSYFLYYSTIVISLVLTVLLTIPFWMPMVNMLMEFGVPYWLSHGLTFFFNISMIESNFFVSQAACNAFTHLINCLFTKQPIHSWDYALHPKKTMTALGVVFMLSIMSYCFANISFQKTVPIENETLKWVMVVLVVIAIDVYHFSAHYLVYGISLRKSMKFFGDEKDKYFVALEERKNKLTHLSLDQWMDLIKNKDPLVKGIQHYSSSERSVPDDLPTLLDRSKAPTFFGRVQTFFGETFQSSKNPLDVGEEKGMCCFP